jgi:hypothetical protein
MPALEDVRKTAYEIGARHVRGETDADGARQELYALLDSVPKVWRSELREQFNRGWMDGS